MIAFAEAVENALIFVGFAVPLAFTITFAGASIISAKHEDYQSMMIFMVATIMFAVLWGALNG